MLQPNESSETWEAYLAVLRPALLLAPSTYLEDVQQRLSDEGIQAAVARHDSVVLYDWVIRLIDRQGISNAAAISFTAHYGGARWHDVESALADRPICSKLKSYWHFDECGYRKEARSCVCFGLQK